MTGYSLGKEPPKGIEDFWIVFTKTFHKVKYEAPRDLDTFEDKVFEMMESYLPEEARREIIEEMVSMWHNVNDYGCLEDPSGGEWLR